MPIRYTSYFVYKISKHFNQKCWVTNDFKNNGKLNILSVPEHIAKKKLQPFVRRPYAKVPLL